MNAVSTLGRIVSCCLSRLRYHQWALVALCLSFAFAQLCTLTQAPLASIFPDTPSYVVVAQQLARHFPAALVAHQPLRTPGYPLLLWLVQAVTGTPFAAMACTPTSVHLAACEQAFIPVVIVQAALYGVTVVEVYALTYWLTHRRWMATAATIAATCNLYMCSWERVIGSELLSMWAIVTVLLLFVRYMRRPSLRMAAVLGVALFAAVMVRPFNEFLPALLAVLALGRALWTQGRQGLRTYALSAVCMLCLVYGLLVGYAQVNGRVTGIYDLSYATNLNLYEKVYELRMQDEPVPAKYVRLQAQTSAAVARYGGHTPIPLFAEMQRTHTFPNAPNYYQDEGAYARYIVLHHPLTFALRSLPDIFATWLVTSYQLYPDYGYGRTYAPPAGGTPPYLAPGITAYFTLHGTVPASAQPVWVNLWLLLSTLEELSFGLLPLVLLGSLAWLWRHRESERAFYVLVLAAFVLLAILVAALGANDSFSRHRFPAEWAMYLANAVMGLWLIDALLVHPTRERVILIPSAALLDPIPEVEAGLPDVERAGRCGYHV